MARARTAAVCCAPALFFFAVVVGLPACTVVSSVQCSSVRPPLLLPRLCVINLFILPHTDPTGFGGKEIRVPYCNGYSGLGQEEDICKTHRCAEQLSRPMRVAYSWINIIDTTHAPDWMTAAGYTKFLKKET